MTKLKNKKEKALGTKNKTKQYIQSKNKQETSDLND